MTKDSLVIISVIIGFVFFTFLLGSISRHIKGTPFVLPKGEVASLKTEIIRGGIRPLLGNRVLPDVIENLQKQIEKRIQKPLVKTKGRYFLLFTQEELKGLSEVFDVEELLSLAKKEKFYIKSNHIKCVATKKTRENHEDNIIYVLIFKSESMREFRRKIFNFYRVKSGNLIDVKRANTTMSVTLGYTHRDFLPGELAQLRNPNCWAPVHFGLD